jgi:hypothetical protein
MKKYKKIIIIVVVLGLGLGALFWGLNDKKDSNFVKENNLAKFTDSENTFSFEHPNNMKIVESDLVGVDGGKRIIVESGEVKKGFEIIILPFDESEALTQERILADVPDMEMNNVKNIFIGEKISALSFESSDEIIGKTFEIWFVINGKLFEARTYPEFEGEMMKIINTFSVN